MSALLSGLLNIVAVVVVVSVFYFLYVTVARLDNLAKQWGAWWAIFTIPGIIAVIVMSIFEQERFIMILYFTCGAVVFGTFMATLSILRIPSTLFLVNGLAQKGEKAYQEGHLEQARKHTEEAQRIIKREKFRNLHEAKKTVKRVDNLSAALNAS